MAEQASEQKKSALSSHDGRFSFRPVGANLVIGLRDLASDGSNMQANSYIAKATYPI